MAGSRFSRWAKWSGRNSALRAAFRGKPVRPSPSSSAPLEGRRWAAIGILMRRAASSFTHWRWSWCGRRSRTYKRGVRHKYSTCIQSRGGSGESNSSKGGGRCQTCRSKQAKGKEHLDGIFLPKIGSPWPFSGQCEWSRRWLLHRRKRVPNRGFIEWTPLQQFFNSWNWTFL